MSDTLKCCEKPENCPQPQLCPLSAVGIGTFVRIKQLSAPPEVTHRLREMGFREEQQIRLVSRNNSFICQICHARLGISSTIADNIWVEPVSAQKVA